MKILQKDQPGCNLKNELVFGQPQQSTWYTRKLNAVTTLGIECWCVDGELYARNNIQGVAFERVPGDRSGFVYYLNANNNRETELRRINKSVAFESLIYLETRNEIIKAMFAWSDWKSSTRCTFGTVFRVSERTIRVWVYPDRKQWMGSNNAQTNSSIMPFVITGNPWSVPRRRPWLLNHRISFGSISVKLYQSPRFIHSVILAPRPFSSRRSEIRQTVSLTDVIYTRCFTRSKATGRDVNANKASVSRVRYKRPVIPGTYRSYTEPKQDKIFGLFP